MAGRSIMGRLVGWCYRFVVTVLLEVSRHTTGFAMCGAAAAARARRRDVGETVVSDAVLGQELPRRSLIKASTTTHKLQTAGSNHNNKTTTVDVNNINNTTT